MKIIKWILGLLAGIAGIVTMFGGQSKREIKKKIKQNDKKINKKTKEIKIRKKVFFISSISHKDKKKYNRRTKHKKLIE